MNPLVRRLTAPLLLIAALLPGATAQQCPRPDGLDGGPCCAPAQQRIPKLPPLEDMNWSLCWRDCDLAAQEQCIAQWTSPNAGAQQLGCGPMRARLRLRDASGVIKWTGRMRLQYSRTWVEFADAAGEPVQVWRFLVNGDMKPSADAGTVPCPVPPCTLAFGRARYTGYIDYAFKCQSGEFQNAVWMLTHACDQYEHRQGFPRGGAFHPDIAYSFVGPAGQFSPSPIVPAEGGASPYEAVRRIDWVFLPGAQPTPRCVYEERIQHQLEPQGVFCACSPGGATPQYQFAQVDIDGVCGTSASTSPNGLLPGFVSMGLGRWSDPTVYPGVESLRWNVAGYQYVDACNGNVRDEVFFGVTTIGGWPAQQVLSTGLGDLLPPIFVDQANSLRQDQTVMNVPFISDHVINLNH